MSPFKDLAWYETLEDISPVGIFFTDAEGNCLHVNQRWCEIAGLAAEEALGRGWIRGIHDEDLERVSTLWYEAAKENKPFHAEYRFRTPQGKTTWVMGDARAVMGKDGSVEGYVGTITDIGLARQHLAELEKSRESIRTIIKEMPVILYAFDGQGRICAWNKEAERVLGYSAEEMIGRSDPLRLLCPDTDYRKEMVALYAQKGNDFLNWEWRMESRDGTIRFIEFSNISKFHPIRGWANWGIGVDVTSRRNTESDLLERVKELNCLYNLSILSNRPSLDLDLFLQGAVELLPPAWQYSEITSARIIFENRIFQTEPFQTSSWKLSSDIYVRGRKTGLIEINYHEERPPAAEGPFLLDERLLLDEVALQISRTIGHVRAKEDLALLKELNAKAEELEQFSQTVTHDLKTPLTAISGFAQFMSKQIDQKDFEKARFCADRVVEISRHMEHRLEEILRLASIGRIIDPSEEIDLKGIIEETLELLAHRLETERISIKVSDDFPKVIGDGTRLREVMENLLENAINYIGEPPNLIHIGSKLEDSKTVFFVQDNGIGMNPECLETIFDPFMRLESQRRGHGLGLSIARRIIEAHGGEIWAESAGEGKGSCFFFTLGHVLGGDQTESFSGD